jgi:hypothetical protein
MIKISTTTQRKKNMLTEEEQQQLIQQLAETKVALNATQKENAELLAKNAELEEKLAEMQQLIDISINEIDASEAKFLELERLSPFLGDTSQAKNCTTSFSPIWRNGFLSIQDSSNSDKRSVISPPASPPISNNDISFELDGSQPSEIPPSP